MKNKTVKIKNTCGDRIGNIELLMEEPRIFSALAIRKGAYCLIINEEGYKFAYGENEIENKLIKFINERKVLGNEADRRDVTIVLETMHDPIHLKRNGHLHTVNHMKDDKNNNELYEAHSDSDEDEEAQQRQLIMDRYIYILLNGEMKTVETKMPSHKKEIDIQNKDKSFLLTSPLRKRCHRIAAYLSLMQHGSVFTPKSDEEVIVCESETAIVIKLDVKKLKMFLRPNALKFLYSVQNSHHELMHNRRAHLDDSMRQREELDTSSEHHYLKFAPPIVTLKHKIRPTMYRKTRESVLDYADRIVSQVKSQYRNGE